MENSKSSPDTRRSAFDWEEAALRALASGGVHAVSIPQLARELGVTKGSFYWHFTSFEELLERSLRRWEERDRDALKRLGAVADPRARLEALFREAVDAPQAHGLYIALSGSAVPRVSAAIRRVSQKRVAFLVGAYQELGFSGGDARRRALLVYSAYIGLLHLRHEGSAMRTAAALDEYVAHAAESLIPKRRSRRS